MFVFSLLIVNIFGGGTPQEKAAELTAARSNMASWKCHRWTEQELNTGTARKKICLGKPGGVFLNGYSTNYPGCDECNCCIIDEYVCDGTNSLLGPMDCTFLIKSGYHCDTTLDELVAEGFCKAGTKLQDENNEDLSIASFCPRFCDAYERSVTMVTDAPDGSGDFVCHEIKLKDCDVTMNAFLHQGWDDGSCQDVFEDELEVEDATEMNDYYCESLTVEGTAFCRDDNSNYVEMEHTVDAYVTNEAFCETTNAEALGVVEGVSSNGVSMEQAVLYMFAAVGVSSAVYAVRELICKKTPYDVVGEVEI